MKSGHGFPSQHGFSGSAGKDMKPKIPGYKHGGGIGHEDGHVHHADGAKEHFGKSGHIDHDGDHSESKVKYDDMGYQHHCHGGKT